MDEQQKENMDKALELAAKVDEWKAWFRTKFMGHPLTCLTIGFVAGAFVVWVL